MVEMSVYIKVRFQKINQRAQTVQIIAHLFHFENPLISPSGPEINGWEFLRKLAERIKNADIKVVMVTSSLSRSEREKSKEFEVVIDFWEKPMDETQVSLLIEKLGTWIEG